MTSNWEEQFSSAFDFAAPTQVKTQYIICSTPRSGSHFLGHLMHQTGRFGYPLEYFHAEHLPRWIDRGRSEGFADTLSFLRQRRTTPNGCFGIKVHFSQLGNVDRHIDRIDLLTHFRFIHLRRRDALAQAVSHAKAAQTGVWISGQTSAATPEYKPDLIRTCLRRNLIDHASWLGFFATFGIDALDVFYEDVAQQPVAELQRIARFLDVSLAEAPDVGALRTKVQRSDSDAEWKAAFVEAMRHDFAAQHDMSRILKTGRRAGRVSRVSKWLKRRAG